MYMSLTLTFNVLVLQCHVVANNDRLLSYSCVYVPVMEGQYKITVKFAKQDIPKCPYMVAVSKPGDPKKVTVTGPGVEKTGVQVNRKTYFEVITKGLHSCTVYSATAWVCPGLHE